jgi:photosystem II stability/assembly factor-like uncharacterized protein
MSKQKDEADAETFQAGAGRRKDRKSRGEAMTAMLRILGFLLLYIACLAYSSSGWGEEGSRKVPVGTILHGETKDSAAAPEKVPPITRSMEAGWSPLGPGGGGGTYNPSFSPFDPGLVLLGTDMGAAFRSEDGGRNWEIIHRRNGLYRMQVSTKAVFFRERIYWPRGRTHELRYSTDKGLNWVALDVTAWGKSKIQAVSALPGTPDVLLVGTEDGLWRTDDHAITWRKVHDGPISFLADSGISVYCVVGSGKLISSIDRGLTWGDVKSLADYGEVMAMAASSGPDGEILLLSTKPSGLITSSNGGRNWNIVRAPYLDETVVEISPGQTNCMYVAQTGKWQNKELFKSEDSGKTWNSIFRMMDSGVVFGEKANVDVSWVQTKLKWSYYITRNGLAIDPLNSNNLILTTQGDIYRSDDQGENWYQIMSAQGMQKGDEKFNASIGLEVTSAWGYHFDPHDLDRQYISYTDIGFAYSVDRGRSWVWSAKGSPWTNTFYDVSLDPTVPGRLYAAASQMHDIPYDNFLRPIRPKLPIHAKGGVVLSENYGINWTVPYLRDTEKALPSQVCTTIALDPRSPKDKRVLYAGVFGEGDDDNAGVYKSEDGGRTWARKSEGLGHLHQPSGMRNLHIYRIRVHPVSGNVYCLITGLRGSSRETAYAIPGGLWRSSDGGETWKDISGGQNMVWQSTAFSFDPKDERIIYVAAESPLARWRQGGLYKTMNGGDSWERIFPRDVKKDKDGYHLMSVAVHPEKPNLIYVGDVYTGLYYSDDFGKSFKPYASYPGAVIQSMSFNPLNFNELIVTSFGTGVWKAHYLPKNE